MRRASICLTSALCVRGSPDGRGHGRARGDILVCHMGLEPQAGSIGAGTALSSRIALPRIDALGAEGRAKDDA